MIAAKRARSRSGWRWRRSAISLISPEINPVTHKPSIDWRKVSESSFSAAISRFKFDKDSGVLTDFERRRCAAGLGPNSATCTASRRRAKTALTDPSGNNAAPFLVEIVRFSDAARSKDQAPA